MPRWWRVISTSSIARPSAARAIPELAEDITQVVFILLARKARSLRRETILSGWLYRTTRFTTADVLKSEFRRRRREQEAQMESPTESDSNETLWQSIALVLDDAIGALSENDRNAIILRFFENRTFKQVGLVLGLNEDTARLRVSRAVEKLRSLLMRRNVMVPEMMLAGCFPPTPSPPPPPARWLPASPPLPSSRERPPAAEF